MKRALLACSCLLLLLFSLYPSSLLCQQILVDPPGLNMGVPYPVEHDFMRRRDPNGISKKEGKESVVRQESDRTLSDLVSYFIYLKQNE